MEMTKFTESDWDAFAGCESEEPEINWNVEVIHHPDLPKYIGCVILDDNVVEFNLMNAVNEKEEVVYTKEFCCYYSARAYIESRNEKIPFDQLLKDGFEKVL